MMYAYFVHQELVDEVTLGIDGICDARVRRGEE
jgi:hypothetical protein